MKKYQHLVFYDGECGFCDQTVQFLLKVDKTHQFVFAPLQGKTAVIYLKHLPPEYKNVDSVILIENFKTEDSKTYVMAKAIFRICWLLKGVWKTIGLLFFLPSFLFDWAYRLIARHRHQLISQTQCQLPPPDQKERFLP